MFWNKKKTIESVEYRNLYHQIELLKIDIAMLQKKKQRKIPLGEEDPNVSDGNKINDGMDELRKLNKEFPT